MQFWAPDNGWKNRLKRVERLTEINKVWNVASCRSYSANLLKCTYLSDILCIWGVRISHSVWYARHQELVFSFCRRQETLSHLHIIHASSGAYPASCPVCNGGSYLWGKVAGKWNWPLSIVYCQCYACGALYSQPWCSISTRTTYLFFYLRISMCLQMLLHYMCPHLHVCLVIIMLRKFHCAFFFWSCFGFGRTKTFIHVDGFCSSVFISDVHITSSSIICTNFDQEFKKCGLPVRLTRPSHWYSYVVCRGPEGLKRLCILGW